MTETSSLPVRVWRHAAVFGGVVVLGAALAACGSSTKAATPSTSPSATTTTPSAPGTSSSLKQIEALSSSVQGSEKSTFKAVYSITSAGKTQSVTIEQAPPKSAFSTTDATVIDTGTQTYYCSDSGQNVCISAGTSNPLASLTQIFSPQTTLTELRAVQAQAADHAAGYNVSFSSGSYAGQSTTCASITGAGQNAKYCVTKQGVLAYVSANGGTFSLTSFSSSPAASDFALPAGATVQTIPGGLPN
jgi:hypothetical protein